MRNCSICKKSDIEILFEREFQYDVIKNLANINVSCCKKCGFCFNNRITQNECNDYYENTNCYTHNLYSNHVLEHERYKHLKNVLTTLNINENDEIIDLTSSDGSLLQYLKFLGYNNLTYCDISEENISNNKLFYTNSLKLNVLDVNDYTKINKKFTLIFFNHTLEHIVDFDVFFKNVKLIMDDNSLLYIEVPDMNKISAVKNQFLEISYEHINFFNSNSLNNLCKKNNFDNIENGYLNFNYRLNLEIKAVYGIYQMSKKENDVTTIYYDNHTKEYLMKYIELSLNKSNIIYNQIDKTKKYSIYGFGFYAMIFLSIYKDIDILNIYDDARHGIYNNIPITNINTCTENENILILTPNYYELMYNKLIDKKIKANVYCLKY
jgi:2-polyprenyl-3-methyl-5-hydroxy-6-metoxy-1,4-benzoquinol methylase